MGSIREWQETVQIHGLGTIELLPLCDIFPIKKWNLITPPWTWASLVAQMVKKLSAAQETWVQSLGREDALEKGMAACSSILAWKIPWTEESGRLQSIGVQRIRQDWLTNTLEYGLNIVGHIWIEYSGNDVFGFWDCFTKRGIIFALSLGTLTLRKVNSHVVRMLKQPNGEDHAERNWGSLPTTSKELRTPANSHMNEPF